jgi:hypothetical protein
MDDFEGLSAEEIQKILASGGLEDSSNDALAQMIMLQKLRGDQPKLEGRQAGRVFVANNPLEHLGSYLQNRNMEKKQAGIEEALANARAGQRDARAAYGRAWAGPSKGPPMQAGPDQTAIEQNVPMPNIQMATANQLRKPPMKRPGMPLKNFPMNKMGQFDEPTLDQLLNGSPY